QGDGCIAERRGGPDWWPGGPDGVRTRPRARGAEHGERPPESNRQEARQLAEGGRHRACPGHGRHAFIVNRSPEPAEELERCLALFATSFRILAGAPAHPGAPSAEAAAASAEAVLREHQVALSRFD